MKKAIRLSRRAALKGLGGATLGLPLLECMLDGRDAYAQAVPPRRYIVFFDGQSIGADGDSSPNQVVPNTLGPDYDLKEALTPLGALKSEVSVVSGLKIPWAAENGGVIPAGGRADVHHVQSLSPMLSGVRSNASRTRSEGATSDQVAADFLASPAQVTAARRSLQYRVQADWYLSVSAAYGRDIISYRMNGANPVALPPTVSPQAAFSSLFGTFVPTGVSPAEIAKFQFDLRARRSVLDLVKRDTQKLIPQLGTADKARMQRHFDELRDLEQRIAAIPPPQTSTCVKPTDPGADPVIGSAQPYNMNTMENQYNQNSGYSNEEQRARVFCDLIHMALACDLSRVVSLQMTMFQSHLNMYQLTGQATDCHELGHGGVPGGNRAMARGIAWHVKWYTYLIQKFIDTPEANGRMIDNIAMPFIFEGGHGRDPEQSASMSSHSTENMVVMLAGRAGGLKPGKHIRKMNQHPATVLVSALKAVGYTGNNLGEVTGEVPELFT
ncbi:MAG: DUF1552 domain-containing protein [Myxococcaceae bacterium]|nr:DUF1552 domain-containing protein [Myxococcaceae bacterium]